MFLLLILVTFASEKKINDAENLILVKIEEDQYTKVHKKTSQYIGVSYIKEKWFVSRWSKSDKKTVHYGYHKDEETAAHASDTLAKKLMQDGKQNSRLNFPDDDTEVYPEEQKTSSNYIGVSFHKRDKLWHAVRWNKKEKTVIFNGVYQDEETAAHASDTLARKFMKNGEQNYKFNFPDDNAEVYPEETKSSKFVGVSYIESKEKWFVSRCSKMENKTVTNGYYKDEETAAHASDTLARKLIKNGEQNHKLNFPDDKTEVNAEEKKTSSTYIGVSYCEKYSMWSVKRRSKHDKKTVHYGYHKDEETAARASDALAKKLMKNREKNHKLNFPDDDTNISKNQTNKRKRSDHEDLGHSQK